MGPNLTGVSSLDNGTKVLLVLTTFTCVCKRFPSSWSRPGPDRLFRRHACRALGCGKSALLNSSLAVHRPRAVSSVLHTMLCLSSGSSVVSVIRRTRKHVQDIHFALLFMIDFRRATLRLGRLSRSLRTSAPCGGRHPCSFSERAKRIHPHIQL